MLYPVMKEKLGDSAAQTMLDEHQGLKGLMSRLSGTTIEREGQARFDELFHQVRATAGPASRVFRSAC